MVWPTEFDEKLGEYDAMELPGQQLPATNAFTPLDHLLNLDIKAPPGCQRLTPIIATMGKSTNELEVMEKMMAAGMNIALINMSFGSREENVDTIKMLRQAAKNFSVNMGRNYPLAIAVQLAGRKIRTGRIADSYGESVELKTGEVVRLTTDETYRERCSTYTVYVDFMYFADQMNKNDLVLLDNETIMLKVEMISATTLTCKIERGGFLGSYKDVFVPNVVFDMPNFTDRDKLDVEMAIKNQVDILIASFVNSASAVTELKGILGEKGKKIAIIANIQTIEGFNNFDQILTVANGIIITRQELGSDITPKKLVIAQKNMIARANKNNIPVCISAHLLSSMRYKKIPLRSELLDIANCILDGADALILTAETAVGQYPVDTVACLASACKEAEACVWTKQLYHDLIEKTPLPCDQATGAALAAVLAAQRVIAAAIVVVTTTGKSAQLVAKYRPRFSGR
ncbi:pyruvate kinase-like isoform X2 [Ostrinia nubilalis]|uniref:pyruvate kinase-like isoform X2 n=1 Tax=Ostrinia nubilalis TaxID=29057 RepID=UPI00308253F4